MFSNKGIKNEMAREFVQTKKVQDLIFKAKKLLNCF